MLIVRKLMIFVLMFAILFVLREGVKFFLSFISDKRFEITKGRIWGLGISLAYILTIIFSGLNLG
jgi:hypothetical protein